MKELIDFDEIIKECVNKGDFYNADRLKFLYLQYRREVNVFNINDLVCVKFNKNIFRLIHIYDYLDDNDGYIGDTDIEVCLECISGDCGTHTYLCEIRHATDLEIKSGINHNFSLVTHKGSW